MRASACLPRSSNAIFGPAAFEAMHQWRFRAGTLSGRPVDTVFMLVNFQLN